MIEGREMGTQLNLSIATAEAFEKEVIVEKPKAGTLWINTSTLYRNLHGSIVNPEKTTPREMTEVLLEEVGNILALTDGIISVVLYSMDNNTLFRTCRFAKVRKAKTPKQLLYLEKEQQVLSALKGTTTVLKYKHRIRGNHGRAMIMTHHPLDLLSQYSFKELLLLESHTGVIKEASQWNTKLTKGKDRDRLPFNILTIQVLGDNNNQFHTMAHTVKTTLLQMAIDDKWNPTTSAAKIKATIRRLIDVKTRDLLLNLLATKLH